MERRVRHTVEGMLTFLVNVFPVSVGQSLDLLLKLLLLSLGLFLQVGLVWAHRQGQAMCVLLQEGKWFKTSIITREMTSDFKQCFIHLKVIFDFILEEVRVFLQGLSEPGNTVTDLQQLHRVAIMVPQGGYVLMINRINGVKPTLSNK